MKARPPIWLVMALFALLHLCRSQVHHLSDNPDCTLPCLLEGLRISDCGTIDQECLCRDEAFLHHVQACSVANCSLRDALVTQKITSEACEFQLHDAFPATKMPRIMLFVFVPTLSVVVRMIVKAARLSRWGADDTTIVFAYCFLLGFLSADLLWESYGLGKDLWTLTSDQITSFFLNFYILQFLYHCVITLVKASILFMFLRIFPDQKFRLAVWATQLFNLAVGLVFLLISLFQCRPVDLAWKWWLGDDADGHCINLGHVGMVQGTIYVLMDIWMLVLPATQVWNLHMKRRKKVAVMFMFSLGLFLTAVSIVRILTIKDLAKYPLNPTVAIIPAGIWTNVEVYVAVFTACIPNIRQFIWGIVLKRSKQPDTLESEQDLSHDKSPRRPVKTLTMQLSDALDERP